MNMTNHEIGQIEKAMNTFAHRPGLIRRDYWTSLIECMLERPGLSVQDRRRLVALLDVLTEYAGGVVAAP